MSASENGSFPPLGELNQLSVPAFADAMAKLFEPAPRFAARLATERPFPSDTVLLEAAARIARAMPEADQVDLINAHPRIGARAAGLSEHSRREMGAAQPEVDEDLADLNAAYEARFGFRYLVHVAGRRRSELIPGFRSALHRKRNAELRRAIQDTLAIAAERLQQLRSTEGKA
ncbi:MAG: 2-oxo-4-hydroxy-4-carboxy-5-ureidoimidazoline decarboxylase [Candidatus Limnocylindria bacterium]